MVKTGVYKWVKSGQMPTGRGFEKVKRCIRDVQVRLIDALGGPEKITPQQEILVQGTIKALGVCFLVELYINKEGPVVKHLLKRGIVELQPCLGKSYATFLNVIRQNTLALGLDRKQTDDVLDLGKYIEVHDAKAAESLKGKGKGSGVSSKGAPGASQSDVSGQDKGIEPQAADPGQGSGEEGAKEDVLKSTSRDGGGKGGPGGTS